MNVSLFATCLVDQFYPNVGASTARLLRRLGCKVDFPKAQTCCGQPPFNSGFVKEARKIALNQLDAFESSEYVVAPSGSCTGMVKHYYPELFANDPINLKRAQSLADKSFEFTQFVVDILGVDELGAVCDEKVAYHPSCHGARILGAKTQAMALLQSVRGIDLVPIHHEQDCCGFGGAFSVKLSGVSAAMAQEKTDNIQESGADILVASDMGCLMHLGGYMTRHGQAIKIMHIAEFLDTYSHNCEQSI